MGMKAEFWCSRWIGVEVVEKDERLDQFTDVARTDQSGNGPMRVSTRAQDNLPGSLISAYRTPEHCFGLHFRSPEVATIVVPLANVLSAGRRTSHYDVCNPPVMAALLRQRSRADLSGVPDGTADLRMTIVETNCACTEGCDLKQAARHHNVLEKVDHLILIGEVAVE